MFAYNTPENVSLTEDALNFEQLTAGVSKNRPGVLEVYLSLFMVNGYTIDQILFTVVSVHFLFWTEP